MPPPNLPFRNVSWKVLTACNYRCTYCLQPSFREPFPADIEGTVALVSECLAEPYEVKIAGGELFSQPAKALALTAALERRGHWISICTNLSAALDEYLRFIDRTGGRLYVLQASLHLEYVDPEAFFDKCTAIVARLPDHAKLVVNNVITRGVEAIRRLAVIQQRFRDAGIVFYTDLLVDHHGRYLPYDAEEHAAIDALLGVERRLFLSKDAPCRAGDSYFALLPDLDAYRCWDGYLRADPAMYLGNMRRGTFALPRRTLSCPYETCSCPTPMIKHTSKLRPAPERVPS